MTKDLFIILYKLADLICVLCTLYLIYVKLKVNHNDIKISLLIIFLIISSLYNIFFELNHYFSLFQDLYYLKLAYLSFYFFILSFILTRINQFVFFSNFLINTISILLFILILIYDLFNRSLYVATYININIAILSLMKIQKRIITERLTSLKEDWVSIFLFGLALFSMLNIPILLFIKTLKQIFSETDYYLVSITAPIASIMFYLTIFNSAKCYLRTSR